MKASEQFKSWLREKRGRQKCLAIDIGQSTSRLSDIACARKKPNMAIKIQLQKHCGIPVEAWEEAAA